MAKKKKSKLEPLKPYIRGDYGRAVVVMRIPAGTPPAEAQKARQWARNVARKISSPTP